MQQYDFVYKSMAGGRLATSAHRIYNPWVKFRGNRLQIGGGNAISDMRTGEQPDATTVCEDIMIVAPAAGQYRPDLTVQQESTSAKRQAEPGGLIDRTRISLNELWNVISAQYHGLKQ